MRVQPIATWREHKAVLTQSPQILWHANLGWILGRDPHLAISPLRPERVAHLWMEGHAPW